LLDSDGFLVIFGGMKKDLQQAYNNFKFLCDEHKCTAKDRIELNRNLSDFKNMIDSLPEDPIEEVTETVAEPADTIEEPLNP